MNNFVSVFEELSKLYEEENLTNVNDAESEETKMASSTDKNQEADKTVESLTEAAEDEVAENEIPVDEVPAEEPVVEEEPRQLILECDKCGALIIMSEDKIVADEGSDLVNVEDECEFCEEAKGYKIVGVMFPYEVAEEEPVEEVPVEDDFVEESVEPETKEDELEEFLDVKPDISLSLDGGEGNDVDVL